MAKEPRIVVLRRIVENCEVGLVDNHWVDMTTAGMLVTVHDALSADNQDRFDEIPLLRLIDFGWKQVLPA